MKSRRLWVPVLAGLLVAGLLGAGGGGAAAAEPRAATASIMIPAAAFTPAGSGIHYVSSGATLALDSGQGGFAAPLSFPAPVVNIKKITLYAYDYTASALISAGVYRSRPSDGEDDYAGSIATVDSPADPQVVSLTAISPRRVTTATHGPFLWIWFTGSGVRLYGVKVTYTYDPGA